MSIEDSDIIWLPKVCGNETIRDAFWSYQFSINTTSPDFTDCFQTTVVAWSPSILLWLGCLVYIPYLTSRASVRSVCQLGKLNTSKLVLGIVLALLGIVRCIYIAQVDGHTIAGLVAEAQFFLTQLLMVFVMQYEYMKAVASSGFVFCYWLLLAVCDIIPFRSFILQKQQGADVDMTLFVTFYIKYAVIIILLSLHLWADKSALRGSTTSKNNVYLQLNPNDGNIQDIQNPLNQSSFLNRITWCWVTPLLKKGFKEPLNDTNVWDLDLENRVKVLMSRFYKAWRRSSISKPKPVLTKSRTKASFEESGSWHYDDSGKLKANGEKGRLFSRSAPLEQDETNENTPLLKKQDTSSSSTEVLREKSGGPSSAFSWKRNASIIGALWRSFGWYYSLIGLYELINIALTYLRPILLDSLIGFVEAPADGGAPQWHGYVFAVAMMVVSLLKALVGQQHFYGKQLVGLRIRSSLTAATYRKALILSNSVRKDYTVGEVVNFMNVDANRIAQATFFLHNLWSAPLNIIIAMYMLWGYLGVASLAGLISLVLLMVLNFFLASRVKRYQVRLMKLKDQRTKLINEILNGIKVLKFNAWEEAFEERVAEVREQEVSMIKKTAYLMGGATISFTTAPLIFAVVSFTVFVLYSQDNVFSAQVAFVSLTLVNNLTRPLTMLPGGIANLVTAMVSVRRIEKFLNDAELDPDSVERKVIDEDNAIEIQDASFSWNYDSRPVLHNVTTEIKKGSFVAIVGQVGAGKSTLISALLGELHKIQGRVAVQGSVAYVPQEAWIRNDTLEKNVLFCAEKQEKQYQECLDACALRADLEQLPDGDQTEIGEKGINLSGGQKQRVSLARAVYQDRDVYLLDDPLSAVDVHVGKHLFDQVLGPNGLLKDKTRVLVTHSLTHLPKADLIICVTDGRISEMGPYADLLTHNGPFAQLIKMYLVESGSECDETDPETQQIKEDIKQKISLLAPDPAAEESDASPRSSVSGARRRLTQSQKTVESAKEGKQKEESKAKIGEGKGRGGRKGLIGKERSETGGVNFKVLLRYLRSLSFTAMMWLLFGYLIQMGTDLASNIWLSEWSSDAGDPLNAPDPNVRLGVYGGIGAGQTIAILIQVFSLAIAAATASIAIHKALLHCIMRCPMSFFDTTPSGRVINRFSGDMNTVDSSLRSNMMSVMRGIGNILTTVAAISYTTPIFLAVMAGLSVAYYWVRKIYVTSSNQLSRAASVRTSPIYSHFGESLTGASSIRAYCVQKPFTATNDHLVDKMQKQRYAAIVINRWLSMSLELLGSLVVLFCTMYAVIARGAITGGLVGLSISYALKVTDRLAMFVRNTSDFESNIVAVERIGEYTELPPEAPWRIEETMPGAEWPDEGAVTLEEYATRYRQNLDLVLTDVNMTIRPGEKVGIVGRTGAGKSSLMLALFRILEPAAGKIQIDGVDVSKIGLHDLRSRLTIIPQDPVLFSGSLRMNLDPFDQYTEEELWTALEHANLKAFIADLPEQLSYHCTEGGSNLSVGQKQLVCLARALLRRTRILVLDEATAAVDLETDGLIQSTIRSPRFQHATVLTIAHRLSTVMDYDRIAVMENGRVAEMDTPANLLAQEQSKLFLMAKEANLV